MDSLDARDCIRHSKSAGYGQVVEINRPISRVEPLPTRHAGVILFPVEVSYSASEPVGTLKCRRHFEYTRVRFEDTLQSDLLRAIRRHRRPAEHHNTRERKRAEISRLCWENNT